MPSQNHTTSYPADATAALPVRQALWAMRDEAYQAFQSGLIPTLDSARVIGVRTPQLRKYAASLNGTAEAERFLLQLPHFYYEENNLHSMLIAKIGDFGRALTETERFLPCIDNWATCDLPRPGVFAKHLPQLEERVRAWVRAEESYTVRYGLGTLLSLYLGEAFRPAHCELAAAVRSQEYYVNMMVAWYFATALAKQYETAVSFLEQERLPLWTHNRTIQKAVESYRISPEKKAYLRTLRRRA